jgi:lipopolysaccharide transport system permease protein
MIKSILARRIFNSHQDESIPVFVIRPSRGLVALDLRELWHYRELLHVLIWRDIKVRYKQTATGTAWAVIQPFFAMVVFSLFFGRLAKIPSEGLPYPIFAYSALLPWQFFAKALTEASTSLVVNERVITKVYFPRLLVPTAVVSAGLLDFGIAFLLLAGMMFFYGIIPSWPVLTIPFFLLLALMTALGVSFWLSALDVEYRDVRYTLPFLTQLWLFATPVVYPSTMVPEAWRALYGFNPMVGVIEGFRWALLGSAPPDPMMLAVSGVAVALVFMSGLIYFRRMERTLADRI